MIWHATTPSVYTSGIYRLNWGIRGWSLWAMKPAFKRLAVDLSLRDAQALAKEHWEGTPGQAASSAGEVPGSIGGIGLDPQASIVPKS